MRFIRFVLNLKDILDLSRISSYGAKADVVEYIRLQFMHSTTNFYHKVAVHIRSLCQITKNLEITLSLLNLLTDNPVIM